ncbi:MAG: two-component system repressor protein LuxO [Hyphomicrobiaceae bacterium]|jgi:two-component system repressor protein LuxO
MTDMTGNNSLRSVDVAVLDDDPIFSALAAALVERNGHKCRTFTTADAALRALASQPAEVLLLDYLLEECRGTELVAPLRQAVPLMEVVFITAHSSSEIAIEALRLGAFDFLTKPLDEGRLIASVAKAADHAKLRQRVQSLESSESELSFEGIVGTSAPMRTVFRVVENVAPTDVAVMIRGESGTGKELIASAVHNRSLRCNGPFVALNMAALPESLVESTLFGHERGAFTGADARRLGSCEEAAGGTLFLDEICEMPIELQAKLLRFLQEGVFRRVGGSKDIRSDARIVSATNKHPLIEVADGRFREDLYYRLNVLPIDLPPLRERGRDVAVIASDVLKKLNERHNRKFRDIEPAALDLLCHYEWPGNVRELLHMFERIVILNEGPSVTAAMLPQEITGVGGNRKPLEKQSATPTTANDTSAVPQSQAIVPLEELERRAIEHALRVFNGSVPDSAQALQVSQATIYRKLKTYGIDRTRFMT